HASVLFGFEFDPATFKPCDSIACLESLEGSEQRRTASRIMAAQLTRIETGVSDIAPSTAGNANLRKKPRAFFQQNNTRLRTGFRASDGRKKTGRTAAGNHDPQLARSEEH